MPLTREGLGAAMSGPFPLRGWASKGVGADPQPKNPCPAPALIAWGKEGEWGQEGRIQRAPRCQGGLCGFQG